MEKSSKIINLLTILTGLAAAVLAYLLVDAADQFRGKSSAKRDELNAARRVLADAEEKKEREEASLRARRAGLTEDLEDHRDQVAKLKLSLPEKENETEGLKKQQDEARLAATKDKAKLAALEAEIVTANETADRLRTGNPATQAALNQLQVEVDEQNDLVGDLELELRDYQAETDHLSSHYASILEGLGIDAENPSWITIGKGVVTKIERLSMEAGMLVLPLGTSHGMRDEMRFFVSKNGKRVGQLVIKDAGLAHSVANIVPLFGNPTKLREKDTVEITGF